MNPPRLSRHQSRTLATIRQHPNQPSSTLKSLLNNPHRSRLTATLKALTRKGYIVMAPDRTYTATKDN